VTNQAVQFQNNSGVSRQQYGGGLVCNGSVLTVSPYYLGNEVKPYDEESYNINQNWGVQMTFMIPLQGDTVRLCKKLAKQRLLKEELNFELVRIDNCTRFMQRGFALKPGSRVANICSDVVPIAALIEKEKNESTKKK